MERKDAPKKLVLNKERIAQLTEREMQSVMGGDGSTLHDFTCALCTSGNSYPDLTGPYIGGYGPYNTGGIYNYGTGGGSIGVYIHP